MVTAAVSRVLDQGQPERLPHGRIRCTTDPILLGDLLDCLKCRYPGSDICVLENDATAVECEKPFFAAWNPVPRRAARGDSQHRPGRLGHEKSDLFINFPKLKTNALTKTTGNLKNIFAFYRAKRKVVFHVRIDHVLTDMNKFLCLVTVTSAWKDKGRHSGGQNVASCWSLELIRSVEACCARIMGFNRWFVDHIRICHRAGDMAVAEIARVLIPGGIIITSVPPERVVPIP